MTIPSSATVVRVDPDAVVTAAAAITALLPIAGITPRAVEPGTDLGADAESAGWLALRVPTASGAVVLALAGPLAAALGEGEETVTMADAIGDALVELAAGLGLATTGPAEELTAGAALAGAVTGPGASAAALGADDLDLGVVAVIDDAAAPGAVATDVTPLVTDMAAAAPAPGPAPVIPAPRASHDRPVGEPYGAPSPSAPVAPIGPRLDLLHAVDMEVTCELGRTTMTLRELLSLRPGSVVELDRAAGSAVDLLVNGTLLARGEVVVVDEEYGVRVTEIVGPDEAP